MWLSFVTERLKKPALNQNGFTFLMAIFMVMIIGIMLGLTGQSWKMIMKREREKELIFRGSQIKEAIENWYNPNYSVDGVKRTGQPHALMDLKDCCRIPIRSSRYAICRRTMIPSWMKRTRNAHRIAPGSRSTRIP